MDEFISLNKLKEVESPVLFEKGGIPNPKGLVSNEIFGVNVQDRKETFAYIRLNGHFFHPHIYKAFKRLYRNIENIVGGTESYTIGKNGELIKDPNGQTGMRFIYDNWDKIKWERTQGMRNERIDILTKTPKNQVFIDYMIVIPAFYRDISSNALGQGSTQNLNSLYVKLIRMCSLIKDESLFDFSFNGTILNIQETLVAIYDYFRTKLAKKTGLIRKFLLGKSIDYSVRSVIAAPVYHTNKVDDNIIDFFHAAVPISLCCSSFYPYISAWIYDFFQRELVERQYTKSGVFTIGNENDDKQLIGVKLKSPESYFNITYVENMINRFIRNPDGRFEIIKVPLEDGRFVNINFSGQALSTGGPVGVFRPMTVTDILFRAAYEVSKDKHIMITRYPILDYFCMFFNRINVASTIKTVPMDINGTIYKWYPHIDLSLPTSKVGTEFIDTIKFSNSYLAGMDGDYDGDQVTGKGLYSLEANEEAERIMTSKSNIITIQGSNVRKTDCEGIQTLYVLTKNPASSETDKMH